MDLTDNATDPGCALLQPRHDPAQGGSGRGLAHAEGCSGNILTTATGPSPLSLTQTVVSGVYNLVASALSGTVNTLLTGTHAGRPPKEIIKYDGSDRAISGNDHAISIDDGTNTTAETLAPSGRVLQRVVTDNMPGTVSEDTIYGYDGPGDSPAYTRSGLLGLVVTTYVSGPGGLVAVDTGGTVNYPLSNIHGDIVGSTDADGNITLNPDSNEFGVGTRPADHLGWLGNDERFGTGGSLQFIQMGVRIYDPTLERFLEPEAVLGVGGNADYAAEDPMNNFDLDGTCWNGWNIFGTCRNPVSGGPPAPGESKRGSQARYQAVQ